MTDDEMLYHRQVAKLEDEVGRLRSLVSDQADALRELRDECHENERAYLDQGNKLDAARMEIEQLKDKLDMARANECRCWGQP